MMCIKYGLFGYVITFDTTFSTNKDYISFEVVVGFNQHRKLNVFGVGLLYEEAAWFFIGLFNTFFEQHNHKKSRIIFTD